MVSSVSDTTIPEWFAGGEKERETRKKKKKNGALSQDICTIIHFRDDMPKSWMTEYMSNQICRWCLRCLFTWMWSREKCPMRQRLIGAPCTMNVRRWDGARRSAAGGKNPTPTTPLHEQITRSGSRFRHGGWSQNGDSWQVFPLNAWAVFYTFLSVTYSADCRVLTMVRHAWQQQEADQGPGTRKKVPQNSYWDPYVCSFKLVHTYIHGMIVEKEERVV